MPGQQEVIEILKEQGIRETFKVIIGGAPTSQDWADLIGADLFCENANAAPDLMAGLIKK
jgi:methanogenic corrinoid protein MtbC1